MGSPTNIDNIVLNPRGRLGTQFWSSDNSAAVTAVTPLGQGFSWSLPTATTKNFYTGLIPRMPSQGASFSLYMDTTAVTAGQVAIHIYGYDATGANLGSLGSTVVPPGAARRSISLTSSQLSAAVTNVRLIIQTTSATGSLTFTDVMGNYGASAATFAEPADGFAVNRDANIFLPVYQRGWVTPEKFGAVGDGVTDDTAAFQAMVRDGRKCLIGKPGAYGYKVSSITIDQPVEIEFEGVNNIDAAGAKIFHFGSNPLFRITSSNVTIRGAQLDGLSYHPATGAAAFAVDLTSSSIRNINISDITGVGMGGVFHVISPGSNQLAFTRLSRFVFSVQRGKGLFLKSVFSSFFADNLYLEWLRPGGLLSGETASDLDYTMLEIPGNATAGAGGVFLQQVFLQGTNRSDTPNNHGIIVTGPGGGLRMHQVDVDGAGGIGLSVDGADEIRANDLGLNLCWDHALVLKNTHHVLIDNLRSDGRRPNTSQQNANKHGVWIKGGLSWAKIRGDVSNQTGNALQLDTTAAANYASTIELCAASCGTSGTDYSNVSNVDPDGNLNRITVDGKN